MTSTTLRKEGFIIGEPIIKELQELSKTLMQVGTNYCIIASCDIDRTLIHLRNLNKMEIKLPKRQTKGDKGN